MPKVLENSQGVYNISAWLRAESGNPTISMRIHASDSSGTHKYSKFIVANSSDWSQLTYSPNITWT